MITYHKPSKKWLDKHGNVYCSICNNKDEIAEIPNYPNSIIVKKKYACCSLHKKDVLIKLNILINTKEENYSDAMYSIETNLRK